MNDDKLKVFGEGNTIIASIQRMNEVFQRLYDDGNIRLKKEDCDSISDMLRNMKAGIKIAESINKRFIDITNENLEKVEQKKIE